MMRFNRKQREAIEAARWGLDRDDDDGVADEFRAGRQDGVQAAKAALDGI